MESPFYFYAVSVNVYQPESLPVPVKIIIEPRSSSRVSLTQKEIIVRLPRHISVADKEKTLQQFIAWAKKQIEEKQYYKEQQHDLNYYQNRKLQIYGQTFTVCLEDISSGRNRLSYRGEDVLRIYLLTDQPERRKVEEIQRFLLRFTERYFRTKVQERTLYWNERYFREPIQKIDIRHTISKWGSCSASRKITFATKLLLLPMDIIDYVIVHELAHLKEMNHSPKFWKHVEAAMPDYKEHRKWLQQHGTKICF